MFPHWQSQYLDALSEGSLETLSERVQEAERAILLRLRNLASAPEREMERFAIKDALDTLYAIKINKLDFPHWGSPKAT